jgi:hypothetical protein
MTIQSPTTAFAYYEKRISAVPLWLIPLLGLLIIHCGEIIHIIALHRLQTADIIDPDTLMRLTRIKFVLATHGWHGGFFPRDNAPYGTVLHWTMLFDLPIIALTGLASLVVPFEQALHLAGMFTGPLVAYGVLLTAWWVPAPVLTPPARQFACYVVLVSPPLLAYSAVGRANYHVPLVLLALVLGGFVVRIWHDPRRISAAGAGGIAAAFCLWLSPELLVIAVIPAILILALLWVRDGGERLKQNLVFAAAFAAGTTAALLMDPPYAGLGAVELDRLSAPYQCLSMLVLLAWTVLWMVWSASAGNAARRLFSGLAIAACAAGFCVTLYPEVLGGPMGQIDPLVRTQLSPRTGEYRPTTANFRVFIQFNYAALLGIAALLALFWRDRRGPKRLSWLVLAALITPLTYLGIAHARFAHYSWVFAAFPIAAFLEALQEWLNARQSSFAGFVRVVALLVCAAVPVLIGVIPDGKNEDEANPALAEAQKIDPPKMCSIFAVREALNDVAWFGKTSGILATQPDSTPATLYWTRHSTLFGPYHRNARGFGDLIELFRDNGDDTAGAIVLARGIDAVLICASHPDEFFMTDGRGARIAEKSPNDTLFRRLVESRGPDWLRLKLWPEGVRSGYLLYLVDRERLQARTIKE